MLIFVVFGRLLGSQARRVFVARVLPLTYAVSLLRGIWHAEGWSAQAGDIMDLSVMFLAFTAVSAKVFRWE